MRNVTRYTRVVIVSFKHKGLEGFWKTESKRGIQPDHAAKLDRILTSLNEAHQPVDLIGFPGYRTHELQGQDRGRWSIWVNGNWRVTFRFIGTDVELIDYEDYH